MAGVGIASYWASVGVKTDDKALRDVDEYLRKIENKLKKGQSSAGKGLVLNVSINQRMLRKSIADTIEKGVFRAQITPILSKSSLAAVRQQIQSLFTTPINVKVSVPRQTAQSSGGGSRSSSKRMDGYNQDAFNPNPWGGSKGGPSILERIRGRPERGSLSAANRRYYDATGKSLFASGNSVTGWIGETVGGGLVSQGASTMAGRAGITLASSIGGMRAGGVVGAGLGVLTMGLKGAGAVWSGLGKMITTPFSLIGGAASAVTSAFYRVAMAAAPLVLAFGYTNKRVQDITSKNIATDSSASRFGTTGKIERDWLYKMSMSEGMRYEDLLMPYSSFLNAYAPKQGVQASRDMFQAFSQYGRVSGATKESSSRAFYALSQMASKGNITSEELNQQLAEAQGYSGAKQLFAEAFLMSKGKTKEQAKADSDAIQKLTDEMKKGNVKADKVFPFLTQLLMEASASGIDAARGSSGAQEDRFWNRMYKGWENFTKGGGEKGIAAFWEDLQTSIGAWFEENGSWLGKQFEVLVWRFRVLRQGITEFVQFMYGGENNSLSNFLAQEYDIDLGQVRAFFRELWETAKDVSLNLGKMIGLIDDNGKFDFNEFGKRINNFITKIGEAVGHLKNMLYYLSHSFAQIGQVLEGGLGSVIASQIPGTKSNALLGAAITNAGYAFGSFGQATGSAFGALTSPIVPGQTPQVQAPDPLSLKLSQMVVGSGSSGMSPRQHRLMYPNLYDNAAGGFNPNSAAGIQGMYGTTPIASSGVPPIDVNVNLTVNGDPESVKLFVTEELSKGIAEKVPRLIENGVDSRLGLKFKSALVSAAPIK